MKILHVLPRFVAPDLIPNLERMGGAERYAISFCRAQRKIGLDSRVLLFSEKESKSEVDGVPILTAKAWRFFRGINGDFDPIPSEPLRFANLLARYDIVHTHSVAADVSILLPLFRKVSRKKYRIFVTDHGWSGVTLPRVIAMYKPLIRFSGFDGLLPVSKPSFIGYSRSARVFEPLFGGVDPEIFRPISSHRRRQVLFVGRITPHKNLDNIIRAISLIKETPTLIVIGPTVDHIYQALMERLAHELGVNAKFLGPVSDESLVRYYSSSLALVLPSSGELFGLVLVEAMACELPVVANRARGIPFAVDDGVTGFLVTPGDVKQLSDKLQLLLDDHEVAEKIGAAGRQRVLEKFTWEHVAERALRAYEEVLQ